VIKWNFMSFSSDGNNFGVNQLEVGAQV